jgi:hypothetical protein
MIFSKKCWTSHYAQCSLEIMKYDRLQKLRPSNHWAASMHPVDKERVDELCQELRPLLDAELAAGNSVTDTWKGWPHRDSLYIMLARPFTVWRDSLPSGVMFRAVDDPHYWKSEYLCDEVHHAVACGF